MSLSVRGGVLPASGLRASQAAFERGLSRLSSGTRIVRSADDAAGLAISERLRSQITGSARAARNVQDGISMLQSAEGGLAAVTSMLQRARDLAVQAASTGGMTGAGREAIAAETRELVDGIDRAARSTGSAGLRLLDGSRNGSFVFQVGADVGDTLTVAGSDVRASTLGLTGAAGVAGYTTSTTSTTSTTHYAAVSQDFVTYNPTRDRKFQITVGGTLIEAPVLQAVYTAEELATVLRAGLGSDPLVSITVLSGAAPGTSRLRVEATAAAGGSMTSVAVAVNGNNKILFTTTPRTETLETTSQTVVAEVPPTASLADLVASGSNDAITVCDDALATVLGARSRLGAVQNRMEHRLSVLASTGENLTAARSRIVDADMALEWAGMVRAQLLSQSGLAVQAQAAPAGRRVTELLSSLR